MSIKAEFFCKAYAEKQVHRHCYLPYGDLKDIRCLAIGLCLRRAKCPLEELRASIGAGTHFIIARCRQKFPVSRQTRCYAVRLSLLCARPRSPAYPMLLALPPAMGSILGSPLLVSGRL